MIKAIIFDMDGVLVNTTQYARQTANLILKKNKINFSEEEFKEYVGVSTRDRVNLWNKKFGTDIDVEQFSKDFISTQFELMKDELKENKEILSVITNLKKQNLKVAVATSSLMEKAEKILHFLGIFDLLDILITADDIQNHKPDPEIYLKTAEKLNVSPEECVVIEDSIKGILAGKNANMKVLALKTKLFTSDDLQVADKIIEKLSDIEI